MPGKFEGLTTAQWMFLTTMLPSEPKKRLPGKPHTEFRRVLNTIFRVLITGCRWCDIPKGALWGSRSASHRWLGIWEADGSWKRILETILGVADLAGMISWGRASIDGMFAAGKGGGEGVEYGFKGKGVTLHTMSDGNGMPLSMTHTGAATSERDQVFPLLDAICVRTGRSGRSRKRPDVLQMDKGYDSKALRKKNSKSRNSASHSETTMEGSKTARRSPPGDTRRSVEG